ncbi:MAG: two-component regulator propeller domain-containing protein [Ignavibacteriaceae bacterium]
MMIKKKFILTFIFFIYVPLSAQNYRVEDLSSEEGVSLNSAYTMLVDHKGFLWFGTMFGLVKYDGKNYKVYRHNPFDSTSISFDDIISLFEDNKGNIWIGTWGGGLNKFNIDSEIFSRFLHDSNDPNSINSNIIWSIIQDKFGNIWAGTNSNTLNKFEEKNNSFIKIKLPSIENDSLFTQLYFVQNILPDGNYLWICSNGKLFKYSLKDKTFDTTAINELNNNYVNSIFKDSKNNYWISTTSGLIRADSKMYVENIYNYNEKDSSSINDDYILSVAEDNNENILVGTRRGLNRFEYKINKFFRFTYNDENNFNYQSVNKIEVDKGGIIWTINYSLGVTKIIEEKKFFKNYDSKNNLNSFFTNQIKSIVQDNTGRIILGSSSEGLLLFNNKSLAPINLLKPQRRNIKSLALDKKNLWVGASGGLRLFNLEKNSFVDFEFKNSKRKNLNGISISSLLLDSKRNLWIGTDGFGLFIFDQNESKLKSINKINNQNKLNDNQNNYILNLKEDNEGNIWIGTYAGLFKFSLKDSSVGLYNHNDKDIHSLSNNYVFSFCEDKNNNLWIGTSNGLNKFDKKNNNFEIFYEKDGLPNGVINGIVEDDLGNLWISTNKGLSKFNLSSKKFDNFDAKDGLSTDLFLQGSYFKSNNGTIYFGSQNALTLFDPSNIKSSNYSPPVYITSINFGNNNDQNLKVNNPSNKIELNYNQNFVTINFAALDYSSPNKILYKYKLEGFDKRWISASHINIAQYKNLSPGNYKFTAMGTNGSSVWSKNTAEINLIINPPFWLTWWFISAAILFLFAASYFIYITISNRKIKREVEIEKIKLEERDKVRRKTAIDFHDEVGHRLTRISMLAELIKRRLPDSLNIIEPLLNKISENSFQLYTGTKDFIWSIDPKNDSLYELIVRLKDFGDEIFNNSEVQFEVSGISDDLKNQMLPLDFRRHLSLIFKEAMNNSLKHSNGNKLMLSTKIKDEELEISIEDNGEGFSIIQESKGNGLNNMIKRSEKIQGVLNIDSRIGTGTKITFKGKLLHTLGSNFTI